MSNNEKNLSKYIDSLNEEKKPKEHVRKVESSELEELMDTVRLVKSLREPAMPASDYPDKIVRTVTNELSQKTEAKKISRGWFLGLSTTAAVIIMVIAISLTSSFGRNNIIYAMEQAFLDVKAYHGILEIKGMNAAGKDTIQAKLEVWADKDGRYYLKRIEGLQTGLTTVNNGQSKWQIRPDLKQVQIFPAFPDPYRFSFELGKEVKDVRNAIKTKQIGEEQVSGREAIVLEVLPQGGEAYKLWIDKETKLPLKKQSAMQNALQYTITYTDIDYIAAIPAELITYKLPAGFEEINTNTEQLVNNLQEAEEALGFEPKMPESIPTGYIRSSIAVELDTKLIKLYYTDKDKQSKVVILQGKAASSLKPASTAVLGRINSSIAEIQSPIEGNLGVLSGGGAYAGITNISSIRWQEDGFEYAVVGDVSIDVLNMFVEGIAGAKLQSSSEDDSLTAKPQITVPVDLAIEENEQKSVDAGHSPWKLDPVFVAQVFVSLQISPEGIVGDYPIKYEAMKVVQNNGKEAIVEVNDDKSPTSKVYLKKLIRQDSTGIWTVVGYDPIGK